MLFFAWSSIEQLHMLTLFSVIFYCFAHIHTHTHTHTHALLHITLTTHTHMYTHMHVPVHVHTNACIYIHVYTHAYSLMHIHTNAHSLTHTHTHTHTLTDIIYICLSTLSLSKDNFCYLLTHNTHILNLVCFLLFVSSSTSVFASVSSMYMFM